MQLHACDLNWYPLVGCWFSCFGSNPPISQTECSEVQPRAYLRADGIVGLGGTFSCIYPLELESPPGGYQMFGRTIPTWDTFGLVKPFHPAQPWLLDMFDQVIFDIVSEEELLRCRKLAHAGK